MTDLNEKITIEELPEESSNDSNEHPDHLTKDNEFIATKLLNFYGLIHLNEDPEMKKHLTEQEFTEEELYGNAKGMSKEDFLTFLDRIIFWKTFIMLKHNVDNVFVDEYAEFAEDDKIVNMLGHYGIVTSYNEAVKQWQGISNFNGGMIINIDNNRATCAMRTLISNATGTFYNEMALSNNLTKHWMKENGINIDPRDRTYDELNRLAHECGTSIEEIEKDYQERLAAQQEETKDYH